MEDPSALLQMGLAQISGRVVSLFPPRPELRVWCGFGSREAVGAARSFGWWGGRWLE